MPIRQRTGSVVCPSCRNLVGVQDERCFHCGRWNPGLWGFTPLLRRLGNDLGFVSLIVWGSAALYVATLLVSGPSIRMGGLFSFLSPSTTSLFLFGASGAVPVFGYGRWWTVVSAAWLHAGLLHILFNMLWVRQLGPATADVYGAARMVIIYTLSGICGFLLSSVAYVALPPLPLLNGAGFTVGASAPIFGLLGALVHYGRRSGSSLVRREAVGYAVTLGVFGLLMPGVDNFAHAGGFAGGYLAAYWLDPLRPERLDHLVGALGCIGLVILSILASIIQGVALFRAGG
ncbi:MAG: rhomboid family intramembrane serine protease [Acidobacteria bacterium]|nr:rhomboid family intramembrane serine protease [Acidobacteriota bacterium]